MHWVLVVIGTVLWFRRIDRRRAERRKLEYARVCVARFKQDLHSRLQRVVSKRWQRLSSTINSDWRARLDSSIIQLVKDQATLGKSPDPATEAIVLMLLDEMEAMQYPTTSLGNHSIL